jgi:hypothetical protein
MMTRGFVLVVAVALVGLGVLTIAPTKGYAAPRLPACADNIDNDRDGKMDFPNDSGCANPVDAEEAEPFGGVPECADSIDNNNDGLTDYPADRGCKSAADPREQPPEMLAGCSDGQDNDSNGVKDYPLDKGCIAASDPFEQNIECADGADNDGDGKADNPADPGCAVPTQDPDQLDNSETDPPACNDGRDNDGDGKIDTDTTVAGQSPDSGCLLAADTDEIDVPAARGTDPSAGGLPPIGLPGQPPISKSGRTAVTLKVWVAKPKGAKARFVFTGTVAHAPLEARIVIRVKELQWKQAATARIVDGRFKVAQKWRRTGRRWCFRAVTLRHSLAPYKTSRSKVVCKRAPR